MHVPTLPIIQHGTRFSTTRLEHPPILKQSYQIRNVPNSALPEQEANLQLMPIMDVRSSLFLPSEPSPRLILHTTSFTAVMDSGAIYLHLTLGSWNDARLRESTWLEGCMRNCSPETFHLDVTNELPLKKSLEIRSVVFW